MNTVKTDQLLSGEFLHALETLSVVTRRSMGGRFGGMHRSDKTGSSLEWKDYSEYVPGDDLRRVDWNLAARFEKYYIRHYHDERRLDTHIYIDASASLDWPAEAGKRLLALRLAVAFGYISIRSMDRVRIKLLRGERCYALKRAMMTEDALFQAVAELSACTFEGDTDLRAALANDGDPGYHNGVSVIVSDFLTDSPWRDAVDALLERKRDVVLAQVLSPEEIEPACYGRYRLLDAEEAIGDERAGLRVAVDKYALKAYRRAYAQWRDRIASFCVSRNVSFMSFRTDEALLPAFLKQGYASGVIQ